MSRELNRSKKQPEPVDELIEKLEQPLNTRTLCDALIPFLKMLDFKAQAAFDRTISNRKTIDSLDEEVYHITSGNEELKEVLQKQFFNKPGNKKEASPEYQYREGLNLRPPAPKERFEPSDVETYIKEFDFDCREDAENFGRAVHCLQQINPYLDLDMVYELTLF